MISLSHETQILSTLKSELVNAIYIERYIMGRQGIKLDKAHAFSSRFLQLCAQEDKALAQWGAIFHTTRQTISNWQTGESVPDIIKLADIAQYFGVSTDYLLGLSDTKSPDASAKAAVEYTGLSEEAVERLHSGLKDYELEEIQLSKDIIMCNQRITSALIECKEFPEIIGRLARAENSSLHEQMLHILCDQYIHEVEGEAEADDFLLFVNPEDRMLTEKLILYINKFQIPSSKLSKKLHMMSDDELIHTAISSAIAKRDNSELQQFRAAEEFNKFINHFIDEAKERAARDFPDNIISSQK